MAKMRLLQYQVLVRMSRMSITYMLNSGNVKEFDSVL